MVLHIKPTLGSKNLKDKTMKIQLPMKEVDKPFKDHYKIVSNKKVEYILEGGIIKVYVTDGNSTPKCVKTIPLKQATKDDLAKIKNLSLMDMILIKDMLEAKEEEKEKLISNGENPKQKKELAEYEKHIAFPTK